MKKATKLSIVIGSTLLCINTANARVPNNDHPTTFLGPTAKVGFTSPITLNTAYSLAGEAGWKNFRVSGTYAWRFADNAAIKFTGEYLWQKITYPFFSGNADQWVQQGAIGADYAYGFAGIRMSPEATLNAYMSSARSHDLNVVTGSFVSAPGVTTSFVDVRRIAGAHARGLNPGLSIQPWAWARFGVELNYDDVRYDNFYTPRVAMKGLGGTAHFDQIFFDNYRLSLHAADRKPFNNYGGSVSWVNIPFYGDWVVGVFGDYTIGKRHLPSSYNLGLSADYFFNPCPPVMQANLKGEADLKGEKVPVPIVDTFHPWLADPAIHMPQVLAIADDGVRGLV